MVEQHNSTVYKSAECKHVLPAGTYTLTRIDVEGYPYLSYFCPWCDAKALMSFEGYFFYPLHRDGAITVPKKD